MADVDIDPFGEHESRTEEPTDENIPLTPVTPGRSTWEPEREHETSFRSPEVPLSRGEILHKEYLVGEIYKLIGNKTHQRLEPNLRLFEIDKDGRLYYKGKPLMNRNGELKTIGVIADPLGIRGLQEMGYNITKTNLKPQFVLDLLEKQAKLPSSSEIAKADDIELEEIAEKASDIISQIKDVQTDTDDLFEHPLQELLGLDKQLRSIRGSLKVEVAKKVQLEEHIAKECRKLEESQEYPGVYDDTMREDITKRIDHLNDELKVRQESIDLLKGRLKSQITSFKETIAKVLDKDTSLGEKIRTLFREQGITIASILTAIEMAIGVLVEALLLREGAATASGGEPPHKDEKGLKEWVRSKLKALASLLGKLGMKAAEALPGITGGIISWILNRAKDVVGWVSQNLWALVAGVGGLIYTYMVTRK